MQKGSTFYMYGFALLITLGCGVLLAVVSEATKEPRRTNVRVEKKTNILSTVKYPFAEGITKQEIEDVYAEVINERVVNKDGDLLEGVDAFSIELSKEKDKASKDPNYERKYPVYVYQNPQSGEDYYVIPMRGNGLWGAVWGYMSLAPDLTTIYGVKFDHASETPGLGAEITKDWFQEQFSGKQAFNDRGNVALDILKGRGNELDAYSVDGISGATITGTGVDNMIKDDLAPYKAFFEKLKTANP